MGNFWMKLTDGLQSLRQKIRDYIDPQPVNLDEAIEMVMFGLSEGDLNFIRDEDPEGWPLLHFYIGMNLRNNWHLWDKEMPLVKWFAENYGLTHADDISGLILEGAWRNVRNEKFDPKASAEAYIKYWEENK